MGERELPLPTFLIIGAQKSATRWLRLNLGLHPDIFTAGREIEFFNSAKHFGTGHDLVSAAIRRLGRRAVRRRGHARLHVLAPPAGRDGRADPADGPRRAAHRDSPQSGRPGAIGADPPHRGQVARRPRPICSSSSTRPPRTERLGIIAGGWYAASLEPFQAAFGERLLVMLHDDADDDPRGRLRPRRAPRRRRARLLPPDLEQVRFSYQQRPRGDVHAVAQAHAGPAPRALRIVLRRRRPQARGDDRARPFLLGPGARFGLNRSRSAGRGVTWCEHTC